MIPSKMRRLLLLWGQKAASLRTQSVKLETTFSRFGGKSRINEAVVGTNQQAARPGCSHAALREMLDVGCSLEL